MNRQTWIVIAVTVALVVLGGLALFGRSGDEPPPAKVGAKSSKAAKAPPAPQRRTEAQRTAKRPIPADRAAAPSGATNVVLVVMDSQRRDQWTVYGGGAEHTPFLAARAREGVVMADALAAAVDCPPAFAAILTGRYPHALGGVDPAPVDKPLKLSPEASTLAERFAAAGWHTVGLTASHDLNRSHGGGQGFDVYVDAQETSFVPELRIGAQELANAALGQVDRREAPERPLYLQVLFNDSHKPPIKLAPGEAEPFADPEHPTLGPYRATLRRQDAAVAALVEGLASRGIGPDNTLFVVIADHGEGLNVPVRHRLQHGLVLYESSVSIPWMWWGKGVARGKQVDGLASQLDLAPTLLALAGAPATDVDGMDLSDAVRRGGRSPRQDAYADTFLQGFHRASLWTTDTQCQADYGSTNRPNDDDFEPGCFDRAADPLFEKAIERPDLVRRLAEIHAERVAALPKK